MTGCTVANAIRVGTRTRRCRLRPVIVNVLASRLARPPVGAAAMGGWAVVVALIGVLLSGGRALAAGVLTVGVGRGVGAGGLAREGQEHVVQGRPAQRQVGHA